LNFELARRVKAEFVTSAVDARGFPRERLPEVALVGRSNVGKSSLINALVRQKVARTSAAPGKTRLANFYRVARDGPKEPPFYLVDLPGYGYARGGDASKREFDAIARAYFGEGHTRAVLHLVDSRHPGLDADRHVAEWLQRLAVPCHVVATKLDKLTRSERVTHVKELERLHERPVLGVSVQTGEGLKELWKTIDALLRQQ
jgi:GTP-binding protein